ncbi:TPA: phage replisome organizer N-terminal domain-containing protein [Streptococcus pyogenes]
MADNKKYYYLKLKENFFESDEAIILESMPDGYIYSNILLKLYLRSLKNDGLLMFNNLIPYNAQMLATITRHQIGTVEKAIQIFRDLQLIEILDNGAIYMTNIQNFVGKSSTDADRKRIEYAKAKQLGQISMKCAEKSPPEIEIELDKERELDKKIDINIDKELEVEEEIKDSSSAANVNNLSEANINISDALLSQLVSTDADKTKNAVEAFSEAFSEAIEKEVKERLKSPTPKKSNGNTGLTKEQILAVKDTAERQKLIAENIGLFQ